MSRKKGFTLIELLAVIVILGIVATLTFIIVDKYIGYAEESAIKETLKSVERASETYFANNNIRNEMIVDLTTNKIELNQKLIEKGQVCGNRKSLKLYLYQNGYCGYIEGDNIIVKKVDISECDWSINDRIKIVDNRNILKEEEILGYRIYGNTSGGNSLGDSGEIKLKLSGKNLLDTSKFIKGGITGAGADFNSTSRMRTEFIKVNPSESYMLTLNVNFVMTNFFVHSYDKDYNWLSMASCSYGNSFAVSDDTEYIRFVLQKKVVSEAFSDDNVINVQTSESQLEKGNISTSYEPVLKSVNYTIKLSEPLRSIDGVADYIDSNISQVVRNVGVNADGTLYKLSKPVYEYIELPVIKNLDGTTVIDSYGENIEASKIQILLNN